MIQRKKLKIRKRTLAEGHWTTETVNLETILRTCSPGPNPEDVPSTSTITDPCDLERPHVAKDLPTDKTDIHMSLLHKPIIWKNVS